MDKAKDTAMRKQTNTERLILRLEEAESAGHNEVLFMTGRYTGHGTSVVAALRRRGYGVTKHGSGYKLTRIAAIRTANK